MKNSGPSVSTKKNNDAKVAFTIPSESGYVRKVADRIASALSGVKASEETVFDIRLCVEEAVRNAMVHGNRSVAKKSVKVTYALTNKEVEITIEDEGKGYDHMIVPNPTKQENLMKLGGRGVYLIKYLMDEVRFNEKGNRITMIKRL